MVHDSSFPDGMLVRADCTKYISELEDNSIDMMITSPPYFMGKEYDQSMSVDDFAECIRLLQSKIMTKIKDGGAVCWQVGSHLSRGVLTPLDVLVYNVCSEFPELKLRNKIVWTFDHGTHARNRLSGRHEYVLWFSKGEPTHFDLDPIRVPQKYPGKRHYKGPNKGEYSGNPKGKNPGDVWSIPNVKARHVEKTEHPCQFPVALASRLIGALTPHDGLVFDPFAGVFTTAIAALERQRRFLCIEKDSQYFLMGEERVKAWYDGTLRVRCDEPVATPDPKRSVAIRPAHFTAETA